jgi:hypothetical protein
MRDANKSQLVRVELEYADGEVIRLVGDEARRWYEAGLAESVLAWNHGMRFPEVTWETVRAARELP